MRVKRWVKRIAIAFVAVMATACFFCFATNRAVLGSADGKIYTNTGSIPAEPVALVLGCAPIINGNANAFFWRRMTAAAALYKAGKVRKLLVSGDNGTVAYDEPTAMRDALVKLGIPEKSIVLDYAGFRTLDSIIRAREIFGVSRCTIVTDDFHLPRALFIAGERHINAVGFQTQPVDRRISPMTYVREVGARSLAWLDMHVIVRQPRFLGKREPI
jgi:SanA protein